VSRRWPISSLSHLFLHSSFSFTLYGRLPLAYSHYSAQKDLVFQPTPYTIGTAHAPSHGTTNLSFLSTKLHHTPPDYSSRNLAGEKHLARAKHPKALSNPYSRIYQRISLQKDIQSKSTAYSTNFTKRSIRTSGTQSQREIASAS